MGRAPCCDKANVKRGSWSPDEDATLKAYIDTHGTGGNWMALPAKAGLRRCGKSCRLRWLNYLRPDIKHGGFTEEDDYIICTLHSQIGSRWSVIASQLPGRTDNDVKNYWNTKLKKKLGNILSVNTTKSHDKVDHVGSKPKSLPCVSGAEIPSSVNVSSSQNRNPSTSFGLSANFHSLSSDPINQTYCPELNMDVSDQFVSTCASTSRNSTTSTRNNIVSSISNSSATFGLDSCVSLAGNSCEVVYGSGVLMDFTGFGSPYNINVPDNYRLSCFQDKTGEVSPSPPCYQNMGDFAFADIRPQGHVLHDPSVRDRY
ncbi:hypothetical protein F2P56_033902 [Juglans regia]|uniref:Transcription factor RAX2-like n=2 Tax=Juglans regia TaxID=51240 RepID=A0A833WTL1_JUGRE|nr:myb-related protein 308-like [Juglans regia]KAF5444802.1 hypothetical protein F2P56_033902 [Juglans regia]